MSALLELTPEIIADKPPHDAPCCADGLVCSLWLEEFRNELLEHGLRRIEARKPEPVDLSAAIPFQGVQHE
jgi:hypothetical protein